MGNDLKKLQAKFTQLFSGRKLGQTTHNPTQSWFRIVVAATSVAVVLCGIGVYEFFFEQGIQEPITETTNISENAFTKDHIETIATQYRQQTAKFVELRSTLPEIPDTGAVQAEPVVETQTETPVVPEEGDEAIHEEATSAESETVEVQP